MGVLRRKIMDPSDIIGRNFGRLTVLEYVGVLQSPTENHGRSCYKCVCSCGNEVILQRNALLSGKRTTCGECHHLDQEDDHFRYTDLNGESFVFDPCDLELVKSHIWRIDAYGYPVTRINRRNYRLSRLIMKPGSHQWESER
jgi:hypothetical protein